MAWWPGNERIYNEQLSPKIPYGLGRTMVIQANLARLHPGLYGSYFGDVFTPSLLIRSRLQTQSKHWVSDNQSLVVNLGGTGRGGRK